MNKETFLIEYNAEKRGGVLSFLSNNFRDILIYRYAILNFISSNMRARYRRSTIGFFWSLLNPLLTMIIISVVFSTLFQSPLANYSIYIFSGLLPWSMILNSVIIGANSMVNAEGYLKKVYIPKIIFPIVVVSGEVINFLLSFLSISILAIFLGAKIGVALLSLPLALLLTVVFLLGIILIVSTVNVYFRDLSHILQVALTGLFYLTPVVYPIELISSTSLLYTFIRLNPLSYFVELFQSIIYRSTFPSASNWLICFTLAFLTLPIGLIIFSSKEKDLIYRL